MCCHFPLFNSLLHSLVRGGNTEATIPSLLFLNCCVAQPITHMRTQEISKDLGENPLCTFSRKASEDVALWHLRGWGGGGAHICLVCSASDAGTKGYVLGEATFVSVPPSPVAPPPFAFCFLPYLLPCHIHLYFFKVNIGEIIPWGHRDPSLEAALLWFIRHCSC